MYDKFQYRQANWKIFFEALVLHSLVLHLRSMKRTILTVEIDPELKEHLDKQAVKKGVTVSRLVRAAIKKATKYKERELV